MISERSRKSICVRSANSSRTMSPRLATVAKKHARDIVYTQRYYDATYEYRHVHLPEEIARFLPVGELLKEKEWRRFGVIQSRGWVHYMINAPDKATMLFRRRCSNALKRGPPAPLFDVKAKFRYIEPTEVL